MKVINEEDINSFLNSAIKNSKDLCKNTLEKIRYERSPFLVLKKTLGDFTDQTYKKGTQVFVMPGLRGVGKTTLLRQAYMFLDKKKVPPEKLVLIDVRRLVEQYNSNLFSLFEVYEKRILGTSFESVQEKIFFFMDETHYDEKWDEAITSLKERSPRIFFIVTGSSALRLTTSDLERRSYVYPILPLNFQEYLKLKYGILPPQKTSLLIRTALFESSLEKAYSILNSIWDRLQKEYFVKEKMNLEEEIKNFLSIGGFPFTLLDFSSKKTAMDALIRSLEQMIRSDIYPFVTSIQSKDARRYFAILHCLIKSLGSSNSNENIYESVKPLVYIKGKENKLFSSNSIVHNVIDNLIKTKLIFPVRPHSSIEKSSNFAWKYYFATSTICSSIMEDLGGIKDDPAIWGKIIENEVAATFNKNYLLKKCGPAFFDHNEGGADFIVLNSNSEKRVFEVSFSPRKEGGQVLESMLRAKSSFGAVIGNFDKVENKGTFLKVPYPLLLMI